MNRARLEKRTKEQRRADGKVLQGKRWTWANREEKGRGQGKRRTRRGLEEEKGGWWSEARKRKGGVRE